VDATREVAGFLHYNWETKEASWMTWREGIERPLPKGSMLYYVNLELVRGAQFLEPLQAHETQIDEVLYKTQAFGRPITPDYFFQHIASYVARAMQFCIPQELYGASKGPLGTRYLPPAHFHMNLPDGTTIDVTIKVTRPDRA